MRMQGQMANKHRRELARMLMLIKQLHRKQGHLNSPIATSQVKVPTLLGALCQHSTHLMTSRRKFPGPTGGSWSASPMKSS